MPLLRNRYTDSASCVGAGGGRCAQAPDPVRPPHHFPDQRKQDVTGNGRRPRPLYVHHLNSPLSSPLRKLPNLGRFQAQQMHPLHAWISRRHAEASMYSTSCMHHSRNTPRRAAVTRGRLHPFDCAHAVPSRRPRGCCATDAAAGDIVPPVHVCRRHISDAATRAVCHPCAARAWTWRSVDTIGSRQRDTAAAASPRSAWGVPLQAAPLGRLRTPGTDGTATRGISKMRTGRDVPQVAQTAGGGLVGRPGAVAARAHASGAAAAAGLDARCAR